jgi:hypothetical protein
VNKKLFDNEKCKTDTATYRSPKITYIDKDSQSRVLIVLSCMEGKAAKWATEQCQKWITQHTKNWRAAPTHTHKTVCNIPIDIFWKELLEEWGDVWTWVEAKTELSSLYQKESTIIDFLYLFPRSCPKSKLPS